MATASIPGAPGPAWESAAAAADRGATDKAIAGLLFQGWLAPVGSGGAALGGRAGRGGRARHRGLRPSMSPPRSRSQRPRCVHVRYTVTLHARYTPCKCRLAERITAGRPLRTAILAFLQKKCARITPPWLRPLPAGVFQGGGQKRGGQERALRARRRALCRRGAAGGGDGAGADAAGGGRGAGSRLRQGALESARNATAG